MQNPLLKHIYANTKLVFAYIFCINVILFSGCKEPSYILIKNRGSLVQNSYQNKTYGIYGVSNVVQLPEIDTIRLDPADLPLAFKKHLKSVSKNGADVIESGTTKFNAIGNLFLVRCPLENTLDALTEKSLKALKRFSISNVVIQHNVNISKDTAFADFLHSGVSKFIKKTSMNIIQYDIPSIKQEADYGVLECHFISPDKKSIFRAINIINKNKTIKLAGTPDNLQHNLLFNTFTWVATFDSAAPKNKIDFNKIGLLFNLGDSLIKVRGVKAAYDSIKSLRTFYTEDNDFQSISFYYQVLMNLASFASDNLLTLESEARAFARPKGAAFTISKSTQKINAVEYITTKFSEEPVIMINEAHSRGQNRNFGRQLLPALYKKGFRYLGVEGLAFNDDSLINQRGYPIVNSGYYVKEPAFGQFIRDAQSLGFKLVHYEDTTAYNPKLNWIEGANVREEGQTQNILNVFKKDSKAKMLVYAGHGHIEKSSEDAWIKMGERLCKAMQRDVPSIECTLMMENFDLTHENGFYTAATDSFKSSEPFVLVNNDKVFVDSVFKKKVNFNVFFPRTNYDLGYPDWLKESETTSYIFEAPENSANAFVQVFKIKEWQEVKNEAIPVIQFAVQKINRKYDLFLKPGEYKILISLNNKIIAEESFQVECKN